jgi:hypothetical protein
MPYDEMVGWTSYFEARPIGWREDSRVMPLLHAQGVKEQGHRIFASLATLKEAEAEATKKSQNAIDINKFKRSGMFSKMLGAKGGDRLPVLMG